VIPIYLEPNYGWLMPSFHGYCQIRDGSVRIIIKFNDLSQAHRHRPPVTGRPILGEGVQALESFLGLGFTVWVYRFGFGV